jgi:hypothetical protein
MRSLVLAISLIIAAFIPALVQAGDDFSAPSGILDAPEALSRVWLRFHETDLCQGMDAVFVFNKSGMEAWIRIEDRKSYEKLERILEPLHEVFQIVLYVTNPEEDEDSDSYWEPPSSLWENNELRSSLGDPFARAKERMDLANQRNLIVFPADEILRQRLLVYADEVLERNRKIKRYASNLPSLAHLSTDPAFESELRLKAAEVCKAHARNLEKELNKLGKSLKYAFPRSRDDDVPAEQKQPGKAGKSLVEMAEQIALESRDVTYRVDGFIHPKNHTVDLNELRRPGLLEAIERLEEMVSDFQNEPAEAIHR